MTSPTSFIQSSSFGSPQSLSALRHKNIIDITRRQLIIKLGVQPFCVTVTLTFGFCSTVWIGQVTAEMMTLSDVLHLKK